MGKTVIQWQHEPKCYCWVPDRRRCTGEISEYVMGAIESESPTLGFSFQRSNFWVKQSEAYYVELDLSNII
jgi:hypothetical protein